MTKQTTIETVLIPLALIAVEISESVDWVANHFGDEVEYDDIGMRAISAAEARAFFAERADWQARIDEEQARQWAAAEDTVPIDGQRG